MNIFIAGGSGTIGIPLVRALTAAGHTVTAMTRSTTKHGDLNQMGATAIVADALNREAVFAAVREANPTHVIHQLTALPKSGPRNSGDVEATNRLRIDGTRHLLDAAIDAGARRFIVGSFALLAPREAVTAQSGNAAAIAVESMEKQVLDATANGAIEGVVLRYGMFYSSETPSTIAMVDMIRKRRLPAVRNDASQLPLIHVEDAVTATLRALDIAPAGSVYDIVDDQSVHFSEIVEGIAEFTNSAKPFRVPSWVPRLVSPYLARMISIRLPLSNTKAKTELGWQLKYRTMREGLAHMFRRTA
jgi:nucleoside-diphosphate-sugar epimerase